LKYINNQQHLWTVCLGVPNSTYIWQVADSSEQNGSYKIALAKAKAKYLTFKAANNQCFVPTDIFPLIKVAWDKSFNQKTVARSAVLQRGWYPLTYVLVNHPGLRRNVLKTDKLQQSTVAETDDNIVVTKSQDSSNFTFQINNGKQAMSNMLDNLIAEQSKSLARKRKYKEAQQNKQQKDKAINLFAHVTNITTSQLAMNNCWTLSPAVLEKIKREIRVRRL
jgi:hypothetical protein